MFCLYINELIRSYENLVLNFFIPLLGLVHYYKCDLFFISETKTDKINVIKLIKSQKFIF